MASLQDGASHSHLLVFDLLWGSLLHCQEQPGSPKLHSMAKIMKCSLLGWITEDIAASTLLSRTPCSGWSQLPCCEDTGAARGTSHMMKVEASHPQTLTCWVVGVTHFGGGSSSPSPFHILTATLSQNHPANPFWNAWPIKTEVINVYFCFRSLCHELICNAALHY